MGFWNKASGPDRNRQDRPLGSGTTSNARRACRARLQVERPRYSAKIPGKTALGPLFLGLLAACSRWSPGRLFTAMTNGCAKRPGLRINHAKEMRTHTRIYIYIMV